MNVTDCIISVYIHLPALALFTFLGITVYVLRHFHTNPFTLLIYEGNGGGSKRDTESRKKGKESDNEVGE